MKPGTLPTEQQCLEAILGMMLSPGILTSIFGVIIQHQKNNRKIRLLDQLQNRFRLFDYSDESLELLIQKIKKATYLQGYSSMIYETAKLINQKKIRLDYPHLKMIKGTSEKIYPHYQEEVQKAFGKKIISEYGAAEAGIIAFECPAGNMHVNMEGVYLQEENNEIIVTKFSFLFFPYHSVPLRRFCKICTSGYSMCLWNGSSNYRRSRG